MTREDAYYERIKLLCGDWASYDKWLNSYLETENPLSDIILTLIDCGDDMKEVEYRLHLYCLEYPFDEESVYTRLRVELYDRYEKNEMTTDEVMSALYHFSRVIPFCTFSNCCAGLSDYYCLVEEGVVDTKKFDTILKEWLKNGDLINTEKMWEII